MTDWIRTTWGDVLTLQRGFDITKAEQDLSGAVPVVSSGGISSYHSVPAASAPGVVMGRKGTLGRVFFLAEPYWPHDTTLWVKDFKGNDARFVYYALKMLDMSSMNVGSSNPTLNRNHVHPIPVLWPPTLDDQRRIASVLGALDDLIETERSLAEAAIALVNAEFTRRFGDRPLSIDAGSLGRVVDCLHSKKPELVSGGRTLMQLNNIRDDGLVDRGPSYGISDSDYANWSRKLETRPGDLVITNVGRIGAVARIPDDYAVAIGRNMTALRPAHPELDGAFLIASFLSSAVRSEIETRTDAGTVMSALNVRSIPHLRLHDSTPDERAEFQQVAAPLLREADGSLASILDLSRARDELLPLLMSGKVRVSEDLAVV